MKSILLSLLLLLPNFVSASENHTCDPSQGRTLTQQDIKAYEQYLQNLEKEYTWLFEELIPQDKRSGELLDKAKKTFFKHLADSWEVFPKPGEVWGAPLPAFSSGVREITGKITYVGFFRLPYHYDLIADGKGGLSIEVRVHFQNPKGQDLANLRQYMKDAEDLWNKSQVHLSFPYSFKFLVETVGSRAHFSVSLKDSTRGPYNSSWSRTWRGRTIAHEIGHMMGLADEYKTISGEIDCLEDSLMCTSYRGSLWPHHYYLVLRRIFSQHP
ncbi:MAG: hypothetical protein H6624_07280 [Bdellovibrionaceae bacterium]|nr:hypothetical protein [Bdellovibrionales bacterium]MCB9084130.1 hypothetical protein [Pseudobdellovibrionaceae bacterium]